MWSTASSKRKAASGFTQPSKRRNATTTQHANIVDCRPVVVPKQPKFASLLEASLKLSPANPLSKKPVKDVPVPTTATIHKPKQPRVLPATFCPLSKSPAAARYDKKKPWIAKTISKKRPAKQALVDCRPISRKRSAKQALVDCRPILAPKSPKFPSLLTASLELSPRNPLNKPANVKEAMSGPTFHRFSELPANLRLEIWDLCIPRRQIKWHETTEESNYNLRYQRAPPVIAHVCKESRAEAEKYAQRLTVASHNYSSDQEEQYLASIRRALAVSCPVPFAPWPDHYERHPWNGNPSSTVFILQPSNAVAQKTQESPYMAAQYQTKRNMEEGLTHRTNFYCDRTITATNMIWFDTKRDTLEVPDEGDYADKGIVVLRGTGALTKREVMSCWSREKLPEIRIDGEMQCLARRVHLLEV